MRSSNLASENVRQAETGLVFEEKMSGAMGTIEVLPYATVRVRATGATTVAIDGILAVTMMTNEIIVLNAGAGDPNSARTTVTITIAGANAFVQVARDFDRKE